MYPKKVQNKIAELAESIKDDYILEYDGMQDIAHGDADIDEISGKSYDGFISFQDGGFSVRAFYCTNYDFFTEEQEKWQNEIDEENIKSFYEEHDLKHEKTKAGMQTLKKTTMNYYKILICGRAKITRIVCLKLKFGATRAKFLLD